MGVESLKDDTVVYKVRLGAMKNDTDLNGRSPDTRLIQRYVMGDGLCSSTYTHRANRLQNNRQDGKKAMESLELPRMATWGKECEELGQSRVLMDSPIFN